MQKHQKACKDQGNTSPPAQDSNLLIFLLSIHAILSPPELSDSVVSVVPYNLFCLVLIVGRATQDLQHRCSRAVCLRTSMTSSEAASWHQGCYGNSQAWERRRNCSFHGRFSLHLLYGRLCPPAPPLGEVPRAAHGGCPPPPFPSSFTGWEPARDPVPPFSSFMDGGGRNLAGDRGGVAQPGTAAAVAQPLRLEAVMGMGAPSPSGAAAVAAKALPPAATCCDVTRSRAEGGRASTIISWGRTRGGGPRPVPGGDISRTRGAVVLSSPGLGPTLK